MMFKKLSLVVMILLLSGLAVGCNKSEEEATEEKTPTTEAKPSPPPAQSPSTNGNNSASPPPVQTFEPKTGNIGLIPPTTAKQRRQEISSGRPDPYAPFPAKVDVTRPESSC